MTGTERRQERRTGRVRRRVERRKAHKKGRKERHECGQAARRKSNTQRERAPSLGSYVRRPQRAHVGIVFFGRIGELQCRPSGISFGGIGLGTEPSITQCNVNLSARDVPPDSDIGPAVFGAIERHLRHVLLSTTTARELTCH